MPLGAGGMGEVYRAKDTGLGRDVPLKFFRKLSCMMKRLGGDLNAKRN